MSTEMAPDEVELEMPEATPEPQHKRRARLSRERIVKAGKFGLAAVVLGYAGNTAYDYVHSNLQILGLIGVQKAVPILEADLKLTESSLLSRSGHIMAEHAYGIEAGLEELGVTLRPSLKDDLNEMRGERNAAVAEALSPVYQTGYQQALSGAWSEEGLNQLVESTLFISYAENAPLAQPGANGPQQVSPIATLNAGVLAEVKFAADNITGYFGTLDLQAIDNFDKEMRDYLVTTIHLEVTDMSERIGALVGKLDPAEIGDAAHLATFDFEPD